MNNRVNYTAVGTFVVSLISAAIIISVWLSTSNSSSDTLKLYNAYFNESVAGLNINASVKFNGVSVGSVQSIHLRHDNPQQVHIILGVDQDVPINNSVTATLRAQGITGIVYVELTASNKHAPLLQAITGEQYPTIKATPSLMFRLDTAAKDVTADIRKISNDMQSLVSPHNRKVFEHALNDLNESASYAKIFLKNSSAASNKFPSLVDNLNSTSKEVRELSEKLHSAIANSQLAIKNISNQVTPELTGTLGQVKKLTKQLQTLSGNLNHNPTELIRGRIQAPPGPGEK